MCAAFSERATHAQADYEIRALADIDRVARGGIEQRTETQEWEIDDKGVERLVGRRVQTKSTLPDWRAHESRLKYRHPDRYALTRIQVDDGMPLDVQLDDETLAEIALLLLNQLDAINVERVNDDKQGSAADRSES